MTATVAWMREPVRASAATSSGTPVQVRASSAGSELSRQVPVDLEADADLNEGRGAPGHWSCSSAFQSGDKLDRGTPPRKPRPHGRTHTYSATEFYYRPPREAPRDNLSGVSLCRESPIRYLEAPAMSLSP